MKSINEYEKKVAISLLPNPMKHLATLRIEINPNELSNLGYLDIFDELCYYLRQLGFNVSVDKNQTFNYSDFPNIIEILLPPYTSEVKIAKDLTEKLEEIFGVDSVINRVMIKKELKK